MTAADDATRKPGQKLEASACELSRRKRAEEIVAKAENVTGSQINPIAWTTLINAIAEALPKPISEEELEREAKARAREVFDGDEIRRVTYLRGIYWGARFGAGRTMLELLPSEDEAVDYAKHLDSDGYFGAMDMYRFIRSMLGGG